MSKNKEVYNEGLFEELSCEEDMKIVGGNNVYKAISGVINSICVSIKKEVV